MRSNAVRVLIPLVLLVSLACSSQVEAQAVTPLKFGDKYPAGTFVNLNRGEGQPVRVNMATVLGKKPVIRIPYSVIRNICREFSPSDYRLRLSDPDAIAVKSTLSRHVA